MPVLALDIASATAPAREDNLRTGPPRPRRRFSASQNKRRGAGLSLSSCAERRRCAPCEDEGVCWKGPE